MKNLFMIACMAVFSLSVQAANRGPEKQVAEAAMNPVFKKVDITVTVNGYTIHVVGNISYNVWSGHVTITATLTITGNGVNIEVPYNYSGSLKAGKGGYEYKYDESKLADEDREPVRMIVSHIYFPADKDPKKVRVE
jgi:hypothetical protein